jgi:hypothetical protein
MNHTVNVYVKSDGGLKETRFKSKKRRGDCVVRAITIALGKSYEEVFNDLCDLAKETGFFPNSEETFTLYLKKNGWIKNKPQRVGKYLKTLENFNSNDTTAIVNVRNHLVCVSDGKIYDTWDSKYRCANSYYTKKQEEENER